MTENVRSGHMRVPDAVAAARVHVVQLRARQNERIREKAVRRREHLSRGHVVGRRWIRRHQRLHRRRCGRCDWRRAMESKIGTATEITPATIERDHAEPRPAAATACDLLGGWDQFNGVGDCEKIAREPSCSHSRIGWFDDPSGVPIRERRAAVFRSARRGREPRGEATTGRIACENRARWRSVGRGGRGGRRSVAGSVRGRGGHSLTLKLGGLRDRLVGMRGVDEGRVDVLIRSRTGSSGAP